MVKATVYYWDGLRFVSGYEGEWIKYPHPDRVYYGISPYETVGIYGANLYHLQIDQTTSITAIASIDLVCAAIGAKICGVIGALVGAALGVVITYVSQKYFLDEYSCIWVWVASSFKNWLDANWYYLLTESSKNPGYVIGLIVAVLYATGYLRVGAITFIYDILNGDLNGDKTIDLADVDMVFRALGSWNSICDLNHDGKVNYQDLGLEFGYYLGWQTRHYTYAPPIETTVTAFGQTINEIARKYP
jgi:hypothetical protein